jgi:hypothetical protein
MGENNPDSQICSVPPVPMAVRAYEVPRLVFIGNLNDLLAGVGSKNVDGGACTGAPGNDPTMCPG